MKRLHRFAAFALLILLTGCASLGLQPAKSFEERLAYAYASHTAVLQATTSSLNLGAISSADAERVLHEADSARTALDAAHLAVGAGDITTAEGRLAAALTVLTNLQAYLHEKARRQP